MAGVKIVTYKQYLDGFKKNELSKFLKIFNIEYTNKDKKEKLIKELDNKLEKNIYKFLEFCQKEDLKNVKICIKKKGIIKVRRNFVLQKFLKYLVNLSFVIEDNNETYYIPKDVLDIIQKLIKDDKLLTKISNNTKKQSIIIGIVNAYGAVNYDYLYELYSKTYTVSKEELLVYIETLICFFNNIKIIKDKNTVFIAHNNLTLKECKKYVKVKNDYYVFTNLDFIEIYNFKYFLNFKSYKKLLKFVKRNYYLEKRDFNVFNRDVINPFLANYQINEIKAIDALSESIDNYFEYNNDKHKEKFINLIKELTLDYPKWELKGYSERKK